MLDWLNGLWKFILSFIAPQDKKVIVLAGDLQKLDISNLSREQIRALGNKDSHLAAYRPWPNSYYVLVGTVAGPEGKISYRLKDPVSGKEFVMDREIINIMLYHDVIKR